MKQDFVKKTFEKIDEYKEWNAKVSSLKTEYDMLESQYQEKLTMYHGVDNEMTRIIEQKKEDVKNLSSQIDELKQNLLNLEISKTQTEAEIASNEKKITELKDTLSLLEENFNTQSLRINTEIDVLSETLTKRRNTLDELNEECLAFKTFRESLEEECKQLTQTNQSLAEQNLTFLQNKKDAQILIDRAKSKQCPDLKH